MGYKNTPRLKQTICQTPVLLVLSPLHDFKAAETLLDVYKFEYLKSYGQRG